MRLDEKVSIITGSARGIGKAIGLRLAKKGTSVVFTGLNGQQAEPAASEGKQKGGKAIAVTVDVSEREQAKEMVKKL